MRDAARPGHGKPCPPNCAERYAPITRYMGSVKNGAFEAMALNELAATAAARPRTTPRGLVANAAANNAAVAVAVAITQGTRPAGTGKT